METTLTEDGQKTTKAVTETVYEGRQKAARSCKSILGKRGEGEGQRNEIVIAPRKHRGPFPVYASRAGNDLKCYEIIDNKGMKARRFTNKKNSSVGQMTYEGFGREAPEGAFPQ